MKSSHAIERSILEATGLIPNHVLPAGPLPLPNDHEDSQLRDIGRNQAKRVADKKSRLLRFTMAGAGALLLVVPMLVMANIPGKTASLVTTCISLLIFSILIPWLTELGPNEILATTAAYAAVLVVFVGTSLTTNAVVVAPTT